MYVYVYEMNIWWCDRLQIWEQCHINIYRWICVWRCDGLPFRRSAVPYIYGYVCVCGCHGLKIWKQSRTLYIYTCIHEGVISCKSDSSNLYMYVYIFIYRWGCDGMQFWGQCYALDICICVYTCISIYIDILALHTYM